jgi:thiamine kinase-like enzyme
MFCHNDLHYRNVLDDGHLWFVDWEYAGCGDPRFDLAGIVAYHDLETPLVEALLAAYGEYSPAQLAPWVSLFDAVHALWLDTADAWGSLSPERRSALVTRLMG